MSALAAIRLAAIAAKECEVGVIAPYQAQARLLRALAGGIETEHPITCATVHQFQGSELDIVIYDAVDCYRMPYPGTLLTSMQNDCANRLFNVAMSRARGKFIVVGNRDYLAKGLSRQLMFRELLDCLSDGDTFRLPDFPQAQECPSGAPRWFEPGKGAESFLKDLNGAKKEIRIDLPGKLALNDADADTLAESIAQAKARGAKVFLRAAERASLPDGLREHAVASRHVAVPAALIDSAIAWFGQPATGAQFISRGTPIPTIYRAEIRTESRRFAAMLFDLLSMDRTTDDGSSAIEQPRNPPEKFENFSAFVTATRKCPDCGKPLRLRRGRNFFIGCTGYPHCQYNSPVEVKLVEQYLYSDNPQGLGKLCPRDHTSLAAENGRHGVYVRCGGIERHFFRLDEI